MVRKDDWNDFNFFEFTKTRFMAQDVISSGEGSVCTYMQNRKKDTDVQNRLLDSVGEGEGGMFRENSIETCILSRVKQITSPG